MTPEANTTFCLLLFFYLVMMRLYLHRRERRIREKDETPHPSGLRLAAPEFTFGSKPVLPR